MERFNSFSSTNDQIVLTKRQISMIMASMLMVCLFVFIVGFFLGKRTTLDDFSSKTTQDSLHDQIDFLLTTQSLASQQDDDIVESLVENPVQNIEKQDQGNNTQMVVSPVLTPATQPIMVTAPVSKSDSNKYPAYACLIGFGTKKAAQVFVDRLKKKNVTIVLKTMISKTPSGKTRTWYQAITPTYDSFEQLQAHIDKVLEFERIRPQDIKIVSAK